MNIPIEYKNIDTVYHYTKLHTAIESILFNRSLRISARKNAVDPYESRALFLHYTSVEYDGAEFADMKTGNKIGKIITDKFNSIRQLSFCRNDNSINIDESPAYGVIEYYGFIKPRMWDQYGGSYKGVCLAFSLEKIEKELERCKIDYKSGKLNYETLSYMNTFNYGVNLNKLAELGEEEYLKNYFSKVEKKLFIKYGDYRDENEHRIITYSDKEFISFDISNCLIGIIYCYKFVPKVYINLLQKYAEEFKANLTEVSFEYQRINIRNKKVNND